MTYFPCITYKTQKVEISEPRETQYVEENRNPLRLHKFQQVNTVFIDHSIRRSSESSSITNRISRR